MTDKKMVLAFLSEHGDSTPKQISDATGIFIVTVGMTLDELEAAVKKPRYTPFLGRRACPLTRPLWETRVQADAFETALEQVEPRQGGMIYTILVAIAGGVILTWLYRLIIGSRDRSGRGSGDIRKVA